MVLFGDAESALVVRLAHVDPSAVLTLVRARPGPAPHVSGYLELRAGSATGRDARRPQRVSARKPQHVRAARLSGPWAAPAARRVLEVAAKLHVAALLACAFRYVLLQVDKGHAHL